MAMGMTPWARRKTTVVGLAACCALLVAGCQGNFRQNYRTLRPNMVSGDYATASKKLEEAKQQGIYRERDRVVYWLDLGTLLHYAGKPEQSNAMLVEAEKAIDALFTDSISRGAAAMLTSEAVTHYRGEDYEQILLYTYTALNHLALGDLDSALVEVRRADERLRKLELYYNQEGGIGTIYTQDAFLHWLNGVLYEEEGSNNQALLSFEKALDVYQQDYAEFFGLRQPSFLAEDLYRTAKRDGYREMAEKARSLGATGESLEKMRDYGEVVLILGIGESPYKSDYFIDAPMPDGYMLRIALPQFNAQPHRIAYAMVGGEGATSRSEIVEPITAIALKNYAHRLPKITTLAIARATTKYLATQGVRAVGNKADGGLGDVLGIAANIANVLTEEADKRSWLTLPAQFQVGRLYLPPGTQEIEISFRDAHGVEVERTTVQVEVQAGRRTFISHRTLR